jgi:hypothetical protein
VARAEAVHVLDRVFDRVDHPDGEHEREELLGVVLVSRLGEGHVTAQRTRALVTAQLDAGVMQRAQRPGQEDVGDVRVHEQRLGRVADPRPLGLGVEDDRARGIRISARVDVDVAVARGGVDDGHLRDRRERLLQALAAARNDQVDEPLLPGQLGQLLAPATRDQRESAGGQPVGLGRLAAPLL